MRYCPGCGAPSEGANRFCGHCGQRILQPETNPPGWYRDETGTDRYWDGSDWTITAEEWDSKAHSDAHAETKQTESPTRELQDDLERRLQEAKQFSAAKIAEGQEKWKALPEASRKTYLRNSLIGAAVVGVAGMLLLFIVGSGGGNGEPFAGVTVSDEVQSSLELRFPEACQAIVMFFDGESSPGQRIVVEGEGLAMAQARLRNDIRATFGEPPLPMDEVAAYIYRGCLPYGYDLGPE